MTTSLISAGSRATYSAYKPSGVPWLGKLPDHWQEKRLKYATKLVNVKVEPNGEAGHYVGLENIESWTGREIASEQPTSPDGLSSSFNKGDVLFGKLRPYLAKAWIADRDGICTSELLVLRPRLTSARYLHYLLLCRDTISIVDSSTYGSKMPRASWNFIGNLPCLIPPAGEQDAIAAFLDRETARIDRLIAEKTRLIALLAEKRAAVITHAVTKGLDPKAKMKSSGIAWFGQVPAHWRAMQLKFAVMFQRGHDLTSEERTEGDVPVVTSAGPSSWHDRAAAKGPGIVTGRYGTIGVFHLIETDYWPHNTTLYSIDLRGNNAKFLTFMLHVLGGVFLVNSAKSAVPGIDRNDLHPVLVAIPPVTEQVAIAQYLDEQLERFQELSRQVGIAIDRLREYRAALVTAAVTGRIDVQGVR